MNGLYLFPVILFLMMIFQAAIWCDDYERRLRRMELRRETWERVNEL